MCGIALLTRGSLLDRLRRKYKIVTSMYFLFEVKMSKCTMVNELFGSKVNFLFTIFNLIMNE